MEESRIHLLNNGIPDRQKAKVAAQNATVGELHDGLSACFNESHNMVQHYMRQIPPLMAHMMTEMLGQFAAQNGLTFTPPSATPEVAESPVAVEEVSENTAKYEERTQTVEVRGDNAPPVL